MDLERLTQSMHYHFFLSFVHFSTLKGIYFQPGLPVAHDWEPVGSGVLLVHCNFQRAYSVLQCGFTPLASHACTAIAQLVAQFLGLRVESSAARAEFAML